MNRLSLWTVAFSCALIIGFSGCRSFTPSVTYYLLNPMTAGQASPAEAEGERIMIVGIGQMELPGYINRVQMVRRTGQNQLEVSSFHRWADYPDRMIQRVISENLQLLMADARVTSAPWPAGFKPDVTVDFSFLELIGTTEKTMLLSVLWTITGKGDPSPFHRTTLSEAMTGTGYEDLAAAHSRALEALCREVADTLNGFPAQ
ncbi:PqiC family protein [uncultured Desulfosarcina sp.]|uniref:PqiC family protein n=1 Tax=uncultured Desulfosarcina sp. TaxID=218289 RepID=UPI0029C7E42D|nr:PqiC family protein [uncultured Desulfosarcina sp.]